MATLKTGAETIAWRGNNRLPFVHRCVEFVRLRDGYQRMVRVLGKRRRARPHDAHREEVYIRCMYIETRCFGGGSTDSIPRTLRSDPVQYRYFPGWCRGGGDGVVNDPRPQIPVGQTTIALLEVICGAQECRECDRFGLVGGCVGVLLVGEQTLSGATRRMGVVVEGAQQKTEVLFLVFGMRLVDGSISWLALVKVCGR